MYHCGDLSFFNSFKGRGPSLGVLVGSPDVFRLQKEPINSLSYVRTSARSGPTALTVQDFFLIFLHEVVSPYDLDDHKKLSVKKLF